MENHYVSWVNQVNPLFLLPFSIANRQITRGEHGRSNGRLVIPISSVLTSMDVDFSTEIGANWPKMGSFFWNLFGCLDKLW